MTNKFTKLMTLGCLVLLVSGLSVSCGGDDDSSSTATTSTASTTTSTASTATTTTATAESTGTNVVTGIEAYSAGQTGEVAKAAPVTVDKSSFTSLKRGGILNQAHRRSPRYFRQDLSTASDETAATMPVFNGLLWTAPPTHTQVAADLATDWTIMNSGKTLIFNLHENIVNHNGNKFDSEDVKFTLDWLGLESDNRPPHDSVTSGGETIFKEIRTNGPNQIIIDLNEADSVFFPQLGQRYMNMQTEVDFDEEGSKDAPVGTGPYKMTSHVPGEKIEYRAHKEYFKAGLPYLDGIDTFIIRDPTPRFAAFEAKRLDIILMGSSHGLYTATAEAMEKRHSGEVTWYEGLHTVGRGIHFNHRKDGPWSDKKVRQAINLAIDRDEICNAIEACFPGYQLPSATYGITARADLNSRPGWAPTGAAKDAEIAQAKALMAEAGYPDGFEVDVMCRDSVDYAERLCPVAEFLLRETLNIRSTLDVKETGAWNEAQQQTGEWMMEFGSANSANVDHPYNWLEYWGFCGEDLFANIRGWCNEDYDKLLRDMRAESDTAALKVLATEAIDILDEEVPSAHLFWPSRFSIRWNYVMNPADEKNAGQYSAARRFEVNWLNK